MKALDLSKEPPFGRLKAVRITRSTKQGLWWLCQCECGQTTEVPVGRLRSGWTQSCGCLNKERTAAANKTRSPRTKLPDGVAAMNDVYRDYQKNAKTRGLSWELSQEKCRELFSKRCHYCGSPPACVRNERYSTCVYNGIDRVDNDRGYEEDNVVPCCEICNRAKRDLSIEAWNNWITRLLAHQTSR